MLQFLRCLSTSARHPIPKLGGPGKRAAAAAVLAPQRTYKEELYGARRVRVDRSLGTALRQTFDLLNGEGIVGRIRSKREFVPPGKVRNLERMESRRRRFNSLVQKTIQEIKELTDRLK